MEKKITQLENEKQLIYKQYKQTKEQQLELVQEVRELKNYNPFKLDVIFNNNKQVIIYNLLQQFDPLITNKGFLSHLIDSKPNHHYTTNKIKIDYYPLVKFVQELIKNSNPEKKVQNINSKKPYQVMVKFRLDYPETNSIMMMDDINFSVHSEELPNNGKELENNMNEKKETKSNHKEFEFNLLDEENTSPNEHETIKELEEIKNLLKNANEEKNITSKKTEHETMDLKKELEEIKALLKEKKANEMNVPTEDEDNRRIEDNIKNTNQSITFREIQTAQSILSIPSKKINTVTNVNRNLMNLKVPRKIYNPVRSPKDMDNEKSEGNKEIGKLKKLNNIQKYNNNN
ncbi:hypothetical protein [Pseudogracilibacillus sp. SO30301A]|uniref:hypothetical protein n=1 Tax=Pseudogracilibacillus sp. SO30301A TaxID=3098291 RepID=UPI00300E2BDE